MRGVDRRPQFSRRIFLRGTATAVPAAAAGLTVTARSAWAQAAKNLTPHTMSTLVLAARDIFPHDRLADSYYMTAVASYDGADPKLGALMEAGIASLDTEARRRFGKAYVDGLPVASVHVDDHDNDVKMREHAYGRGSAIYQSVGAVRTFHTTPYPSTHNMGTNRMSTAARDGVVNKWGQTHEVKNLFVSDGSQFTSGAACNPTLTIVALAIRQADAMAGMMSRGGEI
jgi:choline dehydrogenase-like flavoprotein